eukprot:CAMPEP_0173459722 /NCGR_PEP_ID=MMETSP1357-20121228/61923_1 /TAXON_ID=77926 /ORGANISM="Hemiselmis rufescens, Strain PCC563" /LENGTH=60 /DNA_ID=CAMNT_0014427215 /DNA_START=189 /DNA_END=368 /DNA_ORIENTATION=-
MSLSTCEKESTIFASPAVRLSLGNPCLDSSKVSSTDSSSLTPFVSTSPFASPIALSALFL